MLIFLITSFMMEARVRASDLNKTKHLIRRNFIGGSDARTIMGDDQAKLLMLWQEKRGERPSEDLSGNLIVQLGSVTEDLNRR
jgi:predicted phage-related endonuclease